MSPSTPELKERIQKALTDLENHLQKGKSAQEIAGQATECLKLGTQIFQELEALSKRITLDLNQIQEASSTLQNADQAIKTLAEALQKDELEKTEKDNERIKLNVHAINTLGYKVENSKEEIKEELKVASSAVNDTNLRIKTLLEALQKNEAKQVEQDTKREKQTSQFHAQLNEKTEGIKEATSTGKKEILESVNLLTEKIENLNTIAKWAAGAALASTGITLIGIIIILLK